MKRIFRAAALLLVLAALTLWACAEAAPTAEQAVADFMAKYGLDETNFSLSYYNTVTGEHYAYNDEAFMVAASTFKLPLNMYYYELERDGEIDPDYYIERGGGTLAEAHERSLVYSENEISLGMLYNLGEFKEYKAKMRKYFTMTDEEIDYIYHVDNYYCTRMMMDALRYLYDNSGDFEEMLGYMKQAQPGEYFRTYVTDYEVAHKYGWFEGAINDVGIIYTPQPFLLAVYTQDQSFEVCARIAEVMTEYTLSQLPEQEEPPVAEGETPPVMEEELPATEEEPPVTEEEPPVAEEEPPAAEEETPPVMEEELPFVEAGPPREPSYVFPTVMLGLIAAGLLLVLLSAILERCKKNKK